LERLKSLREAERRELPLAREQGYDNVPEGKDPLKKAPVSLADDMSGGDST
jgi:hypothetical protein